VRTPDPPHWFPMAIHLDDEIMKAIRAEVQRAVQCNNEPFVQDVKSLREEFTCFQKSACGRSELSFHLDAMKKDLLEIIDEVQELCDLDLIRNRRAVKSLQKIAKQVPQPKEELSLCALQKNTQTLADAAVNDNIKLPGLVDEFDDRLEELKINMLAAIDGAVKEVANNTHERIDKFKRCMERSLKVIRDRLEAESATGVVATCSHLQRMHALMQKQLSETDNEMCLRREA